MNIKAILSISFLLLTGAILKVQAQQNETGNHPKNAFREEVLIENGDTLRYRILFPENVNPEKSYPLVLFLHGAGERGTDNKKQLTHGADLFVDEEGRSRHDVIAVFPQCPPEVMWTHRDKEQNEEGKWKFWFPVPESPPRPAAMVNNLVDAQVLSGVADPDRLYVMGLSMGGIGTLEFLYRWPEKYAAAIAVCGGHDPDLVPEYCDVPVWFFHGGEDDVVPTEYSRRVYDEMKKCNTNVRYMLYPDTNHNSWDPAFNEPGLMDWLLEFEK